LKDSQPEADNRLIRLRRTLPLRHRGASHSIYLL